MPFLQLPLPLHHAIHHPQACCGWDCHSLPRPAMQPLASCPSALGLQRGTGSLEELQVPFYFALVLLLEENLWLPAGHHSHARWAADSCAGHALGTRC